MLADRSLVLLEKRLELGREEIDGAGRDVAMRLEPPRRGAVRIPDDHDQCERRDGGEAGAAAKHAVGGR